MIKKLHDQFQPSMYTLNLDLNEESMRFSGTVIITGKLLSEGGSIELHAKDLKITTAAVNDRPTTWSLHDNDVLSLKSPFSSSADAITVEIAFTGKITDSMHGVYPCYFTESGKRKKLLATQFESHHAREVFPCVDEPAAKAVFELSLETEKDSIVLSNMPLTSEESRPHDRKVSHFEPTPIMSPYLLAFVAGDMVSVEAKTKRGIVVKSWASAAQKPEFLEFSVQEAVAYIDFYEQYFDTPYPLEKCDQVALPDFESGAMENWGLITYRESVMLNDPANPSLSTQQYIALVTAHELAHQWFGNLVTMEWWDDLWLNESFASIMEYIALDAIHPEWHIWEEYVLNDALVATNRDVFKGVQPVRVQVNNPEAIHTLFDPAIVYAKGGKLLKTLHDFIGEKAWRSGLKQYFKKHAYRNTTRDDLWQALSRSSGKDVSLLMNDWLEQPGLPLITVAQKNNTAEISQQRLLLDGKDTATVWRVPLIANQKNLLLDSKKQMIEVASPKQKLLLNIHGTGHFVTNYTDEAHKRWVEQEMTNPNQESTWKIAHLNELIMLARNAQTNLTEALDSLRGMNHESRAAVWSQVAAVLGHSKNLTEGDEETRRRIREFSYQLIELQYTKLGWQYAQNEDSNTTHLRTTAIGLALASKKPAVVEKALQIYNTTPQIEGLPPEIRTNILGVAVRKHEDETIVTKLIEEYKHSQNADLRSDICAALASSHRKVDYERYLHFMKDASIVRQQDLLRWFIYLLRNRHAKESTWQWLVSNWGWIEKTYGGSKSYDDFARYSANIFSTKEWFEKYREFFEPKASEPSLKRAITIGLNEIEARVEWKKRDEKPIANWFKKVQE